MLLKWTEQGRLVLDTPTGSIESPEAMATWCSGLAGTDEVAWHYLGGALVLLIASNQHPWPSELDSLLKVVDSYYVELPRGATSPFSAGVNEAAVLATHVREQNSPLTAVDAWNRTARC